MAKKPKGLKPPGLSSQDRRDLSRILKKARAFKAFYQNNGSLTGKKPSPRSK